MFKGWRAIGVLAGAVVSVVGAGALAYKAIKKGWAGEQADPVDIQPDGEVPGEPDQPVEKPSPLAEDDQPVEKPSPLAEDDQPVEKPSPLAEDDQPFEQSWAGAEGDRPAEQPSEQGA